MATNDQQRPHDPVAGPNRPPDRPTVDSRPPLHVSIVLPVHNERENLAPLLEEIARVFGGTPHEIVAVDDASTDGSLAELRRLRVQTPALRVIGLSRRAGQSAAFAAGWDAAHGGVVLMMDADGQSDPADAPELLGALTDDCVAVVGYRVRRADSLWRRMQSRIANRARNLVTGDAVRDTGCPLKAVRREALARLPRFDGMHRFFPTLLRAEGGSVREVPVSHRPRRFGKSKYGMWNRVAIGLRDAIGVRWLRRRTLRFHATEDEG